MADAGVLLRTRDLFFRARLDAMVRAAGLVPVRDGPAALAVIEISSDADVQAVEALARAGTPVLAFASHTRADLLRAARSAGAEAVPNSELEASMVRSLAVITGPR